MVTFPALCFKPVGFSHQCSFCYSKMHKHGKSSENKQRYRCTSCGKTQVEQYSYAAYHCTVSRLKFSVQFSIPQEQFKKELGANASKN